MVKKYILIIEDDEATSDVIQLVLTEEGFDVDARSRWKPIRDTDRFPDLIILDNYLNGQLGQDICLRLKQNSLTTHIPVILTSAANNLSETAITCKADAFISKPFDIHELANSVKKLLFIDGYE
jgi:DNA-binding response OmpR family regulator